MPGGHNRGAVPLRSCTSSGPARARCGQRARLNRQHDQGVWWTGWPTPACSASAAVPAQRGRSAVLLFVTVPQPHSCWPPTSGWTGWRWPFSVLGWRGSSAGLAGGCPRHGVTAGRVINRVLVCRRSCWPTEFSRRPRVSAASRARRGGDQADGLIRSLRQPAWCTYRWASTRVRPACVCRSNWHNYAEVGALAEFTRGVARVPPPLVVRGSDVGVGGGVILQRQTISAPAATIGRLGHWWFRPRA